MQIFYTFENRYFLNKFRIAKFMVSLFKMDFIVWSIGTRK